MRQLFLLVTSIQTYKHSFAWDRDTSIRVLEGLKWITIWLTPHKSCWQLTVEYCLLFVSCSSWNRFTGRGADDRGVFGADLLAGEGELTTLGALFFETYKDLQRCEKVTSFVAETIPSDYVAGEWETSWLFCLWNQMQVDKCQKEHDIF